MFSSALSPHFPASPSRLTAGAILALGTASVAAAQAAAVFVTGEEICAGQGCSLVGQLTRIPPAWFNLLGAAVFLSIAVLALAARRGPGQRVFLLLHVLLTATLAAEGVLFAYQWHVAGAWCLYCLGLLALAGTLNLVILGWGAIFGFGAFAAACIIFSLLSFTPFHRDLEDGTYATRVGSAGPEFYLLFDEDCPHCQEVEELLASLPRCTVHYNPVSPITRELFPDAQHHTTYDPRVNLAAASLLGLDKIPILVARQASGLQVVTGTSFIADYVQSVCAEETEGGFDPFGSAPSQDSLLFPTDDGCGLRPDCD